MKTIKERAKEFSGKYGCEHALVDKHHGTVYCPNKIACSKQLPHEIEELYTQIATEQDIISRQEERERTIEDCINYLVGQGVMLSWNCLMANKMREALRKAMEGGK